MSKLTPSGRDDKVSATRQPVVRDLIKSGIAVNPELPRLTHRTEYFDHYTHMWTEDLAQLTPEDLQQLIDDEVPEIETREHKQEFPAERKQVSSSCSTY